MPASVHELWTPLGPPLADDAGAPIAFPDDELEDATTVAAEGKAIEAAGVPYVLDGIIPAFGMAGFLIAQAKVGKTTLGQRIAEAVANGAPFLERETRQCKVLDLAAEDPAE